MINRFYYITHIQNLESILKHGIYSHNKIKNSNILYKTIYENEIINKRKFKTTTDGKSLLDYVNLYFQPRNSMMYRVINEFGEDSIIVLGVSGEVIYKNGVFVTDGNAASDYSTFYPVYKTESYIIQNILKKIIYNTKHKSWYNDWRIKIQLMAECLVPEIVENYYIKEIYVSNFLIKSKLNSLNYKLPIIINDFFFFKEVDYINNTVNNNNFNNLLSDLTLIELEEKEMEKVKYILRKREYKVFKKGDNIYLIIFPESLYKLLSNEIKFQIIKEME